jgi:hypothetical protein
MTAGLVAAAFSANVLTLALAWGLFDAFFVIAALMQGDESASGRRAALAVGFNIAATLCLWIAALAINQDNESQYWHLAQLPERARANFERSPPSCAGAFSFSQWLPAEREDVLTSCAIVRASPIGRIAPLDPDGKPGRAAPRTRRDLACGY